VKILRNAFIPPSRIDDLYAGGTDSWDINREELIDNF
jgi:hypothetical protein